MTNKYELEKALIGVLHQANSEIGDEGTLPHKCISLYENACSILSNSGYGQDDGYALVLNEKGIEALNEIME